MRALLARIRHCFRYRVLVSLHQRNTHTTMCGLNQYHRLKRLFIVRNFINKRGRSPCIASTVIRLITGTLSNVQSLFYNFLFTYSIDYYPFTDLLSHQLFHVASFCHLKALQFTKFMHHQRNHSLSFISSKSYYKIRTRLYTKLIK